MAAANARRAHRKRVMCCAEPCTRTPHNLSLASKLCSPAHRLACVVCTKKHKFGRLAKVSCGFCFAVSKIRFPHSSSGALPAVIDAHIILKSVAEDGEIYTLSGLVALEPAEARHAPLLALITSLQRSFDKRSNYSRMAMAACSDLPALKRLSPDVAPDRMKSLALNPL